MAKTDELQLMETLEHWRMDPETLQLREAESNKETSVCIHCTSVLADDNVLIENVFKYPD